MAYAATTGHSSDKIPTLNGGSVYSDATSTKQEDVNIGYFSRLNYDYLKRYMLTATFREDGSSRLPKATNGDSSQLSVGWVMSDEPLYAGYRFYK